MNTLSDLKRDLKNRAIALELIERYGKGEAELPLRLRGIRRIKKSNSAEAVLINELGQESAMRYVAATLTEYDGETLTIYSAGTRPLTDEEKKVLAKGYAVRDEADARNPYGNAGYWALKRFYAEHREFRYLAGWEKARGMQYQPGTDYVRDDRIKGDAILRYKVHRLVPEQSEALHG